MPERLVVIGGVAAGMSASSKARRMRDDLDIVVYEKSGYVSYGSCGFPYFVKGEIAKIDDVIVRTPAQFAKQNIGVKVRHEVLAVDVEARTVRVLERDTGREFVDTWDQLLITSGGGATRPPLPGIDLAGIFVLRTVEDAVAIRNWIDRQRPQTGVIVGGGYIGLEMAEALAEHGVQLTVLEKLPQILPTLDAEMAAYVQEELAQQHVAVYLDHGVEAFLGRERVRAVQAAGKEFPADVVIVSVGVRPNAALAGDAGIKIGPTGAIAVDERQATNVAGVWAAGDVAEAHHLVTGQPAYVPLGTTANKQGRVAGTNIGGGDATFGGIVGTSVVKVFDIHAAGTGLTEARARTAGFDVATATTTGSSRAHYMPGHQPVHVKLVYESGSQRLLGGQIVGREGIAKRIDVLAAALHAKWTTEDLAALDLSYAPPFSPVWDPILVAANVANRG